jgi:hypothetical protein
MRILLILISEPQGRKSRPPSVDQIIEAYYLLQDAGAEVVIASQGDRSSSRRERNRSTESASLVRRFQKDRSARDAISDTLKVEQIYPEDFDGAICMGAVDAGIHSADAEIVFSLLKSLLAAGKPVAIVSSEIKFARHRSLEGVLISGDKVRAPYVAAKTILDALNQPAR